MVENIIGKLKEDLKLTRAESKATKKDIRVVLEDFLRQDGEYSLTKETKLYNKHSGEYCYLLELINQLDKQGELDYLKGDK